MIALIASVINWLILGTAVAAGLLAWYLWRKSRELPGMMLDMISETANQWGLNELVARKDSARILEGLRQFVETADQERRAELRGYLKGGDRRPELDLHKVKVAIRMGHILTEIFPLLGILGTVCALSTAMGSAGGEVNGEGLQKVLALFGTAIDSTIYGLICAVVAMRGFGALDSRLERTMDQLAHFREVLDKAMLLAYGARS